MALRRFLSGLMCCPLRPGIAIRSFLSVLLCVVLLPAQADVLRLDRTGTGSLGASATLWMEPEAPASLAEAMHREAAGEFRSGTRAVPAFGIGARPVWMHFSLLNPSSTRMSRELLAGASWTDRLDVWVVRDGRVLEHRVAGDTSPQLQAPVPGTGYVFDIGFEPGVTELWLRAENPDPLLLPVLLLSPEQFSRHQMLQHYGYGALYGFLLALVAYNAMLFIGMRQRSHLRYSIYLGCFVLMNMAYTGHGYAWLWHDWPGLQRYVILVLMVLFCGAGFRFASGFLELPRHEPSVARFLRATCLVVIAVLVLLIVQARQSAAAVLAFSFAIFFTGFMVALGWNATRKKHIAGLYFLAAACSAMTGVALTTLTVWGLLPYSALTFHAVEFGVVIEATLLALAVAYLVRQHEVARHRAELLARTDPLTGLLNRRAFMDIAQGLWNTAQRNGRPLAVIMLDLDHFKLINDRYGHAIGDLALCEAAQVLVRGCRQGDLAVRWGGEEFLMLLPETALEQARMLAERLRLQLASEPVFAGKVPVSVRASFGVADAVSCASLDELVHEADRRLYRAKQNGRNHVCSSANEAWENIASLDE